MASPCPSWGMRGQAFTRPYLGPGPELRAGDPETTEPPRGRASTSREAGLQDPRSHSRAPRAGRCLLPWERTAGDGAFPGARPWTRPVWQLLPPGAPGAHSCPLPPWVPLAQRLGKWKSPICASVAGRVSQQTQVCSIRYKQKTAQHLWRSTHSWFLGFPLLPAWKMEVRPGARAAVL